MRASSLFRKSLAASAASLVALTIGLALPVQAAPFDLVNDLIVPGGSTDLGGGTTANDNRLGGFGSDLFYDDTQNIWYGLVDRGPGGGLIPYETRVQKFSVDINSGTGAVSNFNLVDTIKFKDAAGNAFNGLNPRLLNGDSGVLGNSFDAEGLVVNKSNGHMYVADEYGPSVYEFDAAGTFVRSFITPANLIPREADTDLNYVDGRPTIIQGRQDNRGFEGLTASPDGSKLYAVLQDPLVNEGTATEGVVQTEGRRSRNVRIVEFDTATGEAGRQFIYQLEDRADINARTPGGGANDFGANNQGRSIGLSAIVALNDHEFLVLERDNRGIGVDPANNALPVGTKRVYQIDLDGATDVSAISLAGSNNLPAGVIAVSKQLYIDIQAQLLAKNLPVYEKYEGLAFGPMLADGHKSLLIISDNDVSVTQTGDGAQFDVCRNSTTGAYSYDNAFGGGCPAGSALIGTQILAFREVPEPFAAALLLTGLGGMGWLRRHRRG